MLKKSETDVWVLTFDHKHDTDVSVYDSERAVKESVMEMMRDKLLENDGDTSLDDLRLLLAKGEIPEDWSERFNEYFNWESMTVLTWHDNLDTMADSIRASTQEPSSAPTQPGKRRRRKAKTRTSRKTSAK